MRIRNLTLSCLLILPLLLACLPAARAGGGPYIVALRATRGTLLADGKQTTDLIADVRDSGGHPAGNGVLVQFQTTAGRLSESQAVTLGGVARVRLTSAPIAGVAHVTAFVSGGVSPPIDIVFTDDPEATFQGNNYLQVTGTSYLSYSATDRVIEATGKNGGARITYRNIELTADSLQLRCDDLILRAHNNITIKRAGHVLHATRLYYSLQNGQGFALAEINSVLQPVQINGETLHMEPSKAPMPSSYEMFPTLQIKLVIVARSIVYFPNDRLQFTHPKFYQDQVQIMSLPYYELSLNSIELFSDQFVSIGTSGFGLELPFYFGLSPTSRSVVYLRHQQQVGRSYYATVPGWGIDVIHGYSSQGDQRYEGAFGFTGLTSSAWDFRWTHSQEFNEASQGSFYLDFPNHDSVYSSVSFAQQLHYYRWGANVGAGQSFTGGGGPNLQNDMYMETLPHRFGPVNGMMYTLGGTLSGQTYSYSDPSVGAQSGVSQGLNIRAFNRPLTLNTRTTLTDSFTLGQQWNSYGGTGLVGMATLSLDHTLPRALGAVNLTYDFVNRPPGSQSVSGKHRISLTYAVAASKRFEATLFGSAFLDSRDSSLLGDMIYRLDRNWRLIGTVTLQRFEGDSYNDIEFTLGRRIGAREIQLTYSTYLHRISIDFTATRF
jgi:hypothetical protein